MEVKQRIRTKKEEVEQEKKATPSTTEKKSSKTCYIIALIVVVIIGALGFGAYYLFTAPLYNPGTLKTSVNFTIPDQQNTRENYWKVTDNIELYHFTSPPSSSKKKILFVHGGPGIPPTDVAKGLQLLEDNFQLVYYHQRGCGNSTRPIDRFPAEQGMFTSIQQLDKQLGVAVHVADIERIRRILGLEKIILIGHSWGGFLSTMYAIEFPERVEALMLISPASVLVHPAPDSDLFGTVRNKLPEDKIQEFDEFLKRYLDFSSLFTAHTEQSIIEMNNEWATYYGIASKEANVLNFKNHHLTGGWMVFGNFVSIGMRRDWRHHLSSINTPVLVTHGANDLMPKEVLNSYLDYLPNAQFHLFTNSKHFPFLDSPEEFNRVLSTFLNKFN